MKIKVTIEESISQTFEVEVDSLDTAYDEVRNKYNHQALVVDNGTVTSRAMQIETEGEILDWITF